MLSPFWWFLNVLKSVWRFNSYDSKRRPASDSVQTGDGRPDFAALLQHYNATDVPPSARVDTSLRQRKRKPLGILSLWRYWLFVAMKAADIAYGFLSHRLRGPRRKSWGWEMTLITSFMRNVGNHSQLADIRMLRAVIGLTGYVPIPYDAIVTPETFIVPKLSLRGLLAECSNAENGARELSGEWVVGKQLWLRCQANRRTSDRNTASNLMEGVILYLHGGGYYMSNAAVYRLLTIQLSKYSNMRVFAVDYRLAPETRFPGQLHDAVCTYFRMLNELHIPSENIIIAGDSAGGGLSLALVMYLRDNDYPLPAGIVLMSPWVDLTMSCDSWDRNAPYDVVPVPRPGDHLNPIFCYLGENLERYITHPYASPLFGDFKGFPPMLIQAGEAEVLRDEISLLAYKASRSGVRVKYELYEDAVHVFHAFPFLEISRQAFLACREFLQNDLVQHRGQSTQVLDNTTRSELARVIDNEKARAVRGDGEEMSVKNNNSIVDLSLDARYESDVERPSWTRWRSKSTLTSPFLVSHSLRSRSLIFDTKSDLYASEQGTNVGQKSRRHTRRATTALTRLSSFTISPMSAPPRPAIRSADRATSHPDISSLCQQWTLTGTLDQELTQ